MEKQQQQSKSTDPVEVRIDGNVANQASPYITAESLFDTRQYGEDFLNMADPAGLLTVDRYQSDMFKFGPEVHANLTAPKVGLADIGYNPSKKKYDELNLIEQLQLDAEAPKNYSQPVQSPVYGNIKEMNFDRFYAHPKYNELGFKPYADNETYYNANSSKIDDLTRAYNQFGSQFGTGISASLNSVMDMFDGDGYISQPDLDGAYAMEDAMRIGSTSRGGAFGTITNVGLSFGYTAGIITSIAIEELILAAGSAAITSTGAGAPAGIAGFIAGTGRNLFRGLKTIGNLFDVKRYASASRAAAATLNNAQSARDLFRGGAQATGRLFAPEVTQAINKWKTTGNTTQNLFNITKTDNLFGAVYRDLRQVNLALAEGKLEAGMVENRVQDNALREMASNNPGGELTAEQFADVGKISREAAFRTQMQNTAIIYFSNKLFLRGAFRGFKRGAQNVTGRFFRTNPLVDPLTGKALKGVYSTKGNFLKLGIPSPKKALTKLKAVGLRGAPRVFAGAMLRYGAGGIAEGLQEVSQEAIAATNEGYYGALLREPGAAAKPFYGSFALDGIKEQFSSQGFETFLSGFLMGGMAGPYQTVLFQGLPRLYSLRSKASRKDYANQKAAEKEVEDSIITQLNKQSMGYAKGETNPIEKILDPVQLQVSLQKNAIDAQNEAESAGDKYNYFNETNFLEFQGINSKYERGTIGLYQQELNEYSRFSDKDLLEAFPGQGSIEQIRKRIQKQKDLVVEYGEMYDQERKNTDKKYGNKRYAPELFKPGTREYVNEVALKKAYKEMRMLSMYTRAAFKDALERKTNIAQALASTPLFGNMAANDVTPLLDKESLSVELDRLSQEIEVLESNVENVTGLSDLDKKRNKKDLKEKKTRKKKLEAISKVYNKNLTAKGFYDRRKKAALNTPVMSYLKALANQKGEFVDNDAAENAVNEIVDYATLSQDAVAFNNTIDYLLDPNKMEALIERKAEYFKNLGYNANNILRAQIKDFILTNNQNAFINALAEEDVYLDPNEGREFLETGDVNVLKTFIFAGRKLDSSVVEDLAVILKVVSPIVRVYEESTKPTQTEEAQEAQASEESSQDVKETLEAAGVTEIVIKDSYQSEGLKKILAKQYRDYQANTFGETLLPFSEWKKGPEGLSIKEGYDAIKKIWGAGYQRFTTGNQVITFKPSQLELDQEKGFLDFINNYADENPIVRDVLQELDVNLSIYKTVKSAPSKGIIKDGIIVDIQKNVLDPTNAEETTTYALLDKDGNLINDRLKRIIGANASGTFSSLDSAKDAFDLLEKEASDGTTFRFGGLDLSKGARVMDNTGKVFVVNTNARGNQTNKNIIFLVPLDQFTDDFYANSQAAKQFGPVREQDFIGIYKLVAEEKLPEKGNNFAKLPPDEAIKAWPHTNEGESREQATERLNLIMSNLTPEEVSKLVIFIKPSKPNTSTPPYSVPEEKNTLNKLPNDYIINKGHDFTIGIQIVDQETKNKIDNLITQNKINPLEEKANGSFAYFPSNQYEFFDNNEVEILPTQMSLDFMLSTIYFGNNTAVDNQTLNKVKDNFATSNVLQTAVTEIFNSVGEGSTEFGKLPDGLSIKLDQGFPNYTQPSVMVDITQVPSTIAPVILDVNSLNGLPTFITNLEGDAEAGLISEVEEGLKQQLILNEDGAFNEMPSNRYNLVVKDPSGLYTVATATPKKQPAQSLEEIFFEYINFAQTVLDTNVTREGKKTIVKDQNIAKDFNQKQSKKLFIKSDVKGRRFFLDVTQYGSISLSAKDKVKGAAAELVGTAKYTDIGKKVYLYEQDFSRDDKGELTVSPTITLQKLVDKLNASFTSNDQPAVLSLKNFGVSISEDAPLTDYINGLETSIDPKLVRKGQKIIITAAPAAIRRERDKVVNINIPVTTPQQKAEALAKMENAVIEEKSIEADLPRLVSAWLQTEEGSLDNQSAADSAGKFALEYNKRNSPTEGMTEDDVTGKDIFNVVGQGLVVMNTVLDEINNQTLAIEEVKSNARLEEAVTLDNVLKQIKELKQEIKSTEGLTSSEKRKALKNNKKLQALYKKRDELRSANKIVDSKLTATDIEDIDVFTGWMSENLPEFITATDISVLGNNLKGTQKRVGAFVLDLHDMAGVIYTGSKSPFRYHEAFHGVFRMLLTTEQQTRFINIAKKEKKAELRKEGKSLSTELQKFRNSWPAYKSMSQERLEREYFEEYLADRFEQFKQDRRGTKTDSVIKSFFNKLIEILKRVVARFKRNELNTLFENIDSGKFRSAPIMTNEFTSGVVSPTIAANKLMPYEAQYLNKEDGILYIPSIVSEGIINNIAGQLIENKFSFVTSEETPKFNVDEQLDFIIDQFAETYDVDSVANAKYKLNSPEKKMLELLTLSFEDFSTDIKNSVKDLLNIIDLQASQQNSNNEIIVDENQTFSSLEDLGGLREVAQYGKEAYMTGGFDNLSSRLRQYITTVTMPATDYFGNAELADGTPFVAPVKANEVYNGLLKALEGLSDPLQMIQKMQLFSETNAQTAAVVSSIFESAGIDPLNADGDLINELPQEIKNPDFLNKVLKAFTNFRVEWYFMQRDNQGNTLIHSASERDDASTQVDAWSQAFTSKLQEWQDDPRKKTKALKTLIKIKNSLKLKEGKTQNRTLNKNASLLSQELFDALGIRLSVGYMRYSLLKSRNEYYNSQQAELNFYPNAEAVSFNDMKAFEDLLSSGQDIYDKTKEGAASRVKKLAINNALFDEAIGASVFKNSNGDLVNSHQVPTYHLTKTKELNSVSERNKLKNNSFLSNNYLLNSQAFNQLADSNRLKISRVSGTKVLNQITDNLDPNSSKVDKTMDYGKYTPGEFVIGNINLYLTNLNYLTKGLKNSVYVKDEVNGIVTEVPTAPALIRVIEASNTGDLTTLPIIRAINKVKGKDQITDEYIGYIFDFVKNEYNRIVEERNLDELDKNVLGFNLEDPAKPGVVPRGFTFANNSALLDAKTKADLEQEAQGEPISFEQALKNSGLSVTQFKKQLAKNLDIQFQLFNEKIDATNSRNKIDKRIRTGIGLSEAEVAASDVYNLKNNDEVYNLKQVFYNSYLNVKSFNELLLGDQAKTLKDFTAKAKRAKGQNGGGLPAYTPFIDKRKGINHATDNINLITLSEPIGTSSISGKSIDKADAQMWITLKAFRHFFFGFGSLTNEQADVLDKIEKGEKIPWDDISGLINSKGMINSKKLVYFDGQTFLKMSAFVLTPELTSIKNSDGTFRAKPNAVPLHNLRVKLEALESENNSVSIAAPLTAIKMLQTNVNPYQELSMDSQGFSQESSPLSAKFMKLQQISPSNKRKITELSQMKTLSTNEQSSLQNKKIKRYNDALAERQRFKYFNKRGLTFNTIEEEAKQFLKNPKEITPNLILFSQYAVNSLQASQISSNLIEFFSLDQFNQPQYNLNNPYTISKFEQLFLTYFSKGVFQETVAGTSFALVSSFGKQIYRRVFSVDEFGVPEKQEVIRESVAERMSGLVIDSREASDLVGVKIPKEGIVILDRLRYNMKEFDENGRATGNRYSEGIFPAQYKGVYELIGDSNRPMPKVVSDMFSVRVPSQDKHSAMSVRMVDFLPAFYGSSAMFADELVEISGADFDIDVAYSQRKDFYIRDGEFIEYGNNYEDYINFINREVKETGTVYNSGLKLSKLQAATIEDSLSDIEDTSAEKAGLSPESISALQQLGLPITKKQFQDYINDNGFAPYEAPINNEIVDLRRNFVSNADMTSGQQIAYSPASLDLIREAWEDISEAAQTLKSRNLGDNLDIDNLYGQTLAFINNKGASIGSVVSPNLYLSMIVEAGIPLKSVEGKFVGFEIDGKIYDSFGKAANTDGVRKQDIISAIVTMMTDNAKEYFVAKLGLNSYNTGLLTNMIAVGVPLSTSLLLINNKFIQEQHEEIDNSDDPYAAGISKRVIDQINKLEGLTNMVGEQEEVSPTREILIGGIDGDVTPGQQLGILRVYSKMMAIKSFTSKLNSVLSLNNGIGKDMNAVEGRLLNIRDMESDDALLNFLPIFKNTYLGNLKDTFKEFSYELLPKVLVTAQPEFNLLKNRITSQLDSNVLLFNPNLANKVKKDLLSYLTVKNYIKVTNEENSLSASGFNNNLIYPGRDNKTNNIISSIKKLQESDPGNFFLTNYITTLPAEARRNFAGINLVTANTWRRLNREQMSDLQTSFSKLYNNLDTRKYAQDVVAYEFVKNGFQIASGSLLEALSPYVLEDYLSTISLLDISANRPSEEFYKEEVMNQVMPFEDITSYLLASSTQPLLATLGKRKIEDMPKVFKKLGSTNPVTGQRPSITYKKIDEDKKLKPVSIVYSENIVTNEGTKGAAQYRNGQITIDKKLLLQKFKDRAWTKPRALADGSKAKPLPANSFKTYESWQEFVIEHERQHGLYSRQQFNEDQPNGTTGQYEDEINKRALNAFDAIEEVQTFGSPLQFGMGFIYGELPLTNDLRKSDTTDKAVEEDIRRLNEDFANAAIEQDIAEQALNNPSLNKNYDGENLTVQEPGGAEVNIDKANILARIAADTSKETIELGVEEAGIIDDKNLPPLSEGTQLKIDLLDNQDPSVSYPEITEFWGNNIENGEFSEQVEAFKTQNDVNTLEDLIDLYENNPNSFWSSQEGLIEQIKRCNL